MLKRWAAWPPGIRWLAGIAAVVLAAALVWALFVPLADWIARHDVGAAKPALVQTARDAARGRLLTLAAGLFAAGALVFTALNFTLSRRTFELTEQGQVTDRFTKAVEQLGHETLDVRIGGIYALERISRDSAKDHPTVMEVLTAFIREHSQEPWPVDGSGVQHGEKKTRPDVQAAVTVVGRRDAKRDILVIDLTAADLTGAVLTDANLARTVLTRADLTVAVLTRADLGDANLTAAILTNADLGGADLGGADLTARPHRRGPRRRGPHQHGPDPRAPRRREPHRREPHPRAPQRRGPHPRALRIREPHLRAPHPRGPHRRGPHHRGPHRRGPHRRQVAGRSASSGRLDGRR